MNFDTYSDDQTPPLNASGCGLSKSTKRARRRRVELRRIRSAPARHDMCLRKVKSRAKEEPMADAGEGVPEPTKSYGKISVVGRRREMDDVVAVELGFLKRGELESYDLFGVYGGCGGWRVARACGQMPHKSLAKLVGEKSSEECVDWEEVMAAAFNMMDAAVETGSTAVVAVVGKNEVVVASCGGSRVVLSRGGVALQLLDDYKPHDKGDIPEKTSVVGLNSNRGTVPAASTPVVTKVRVMKRSEADEFLILGSRGLWDVIPNELACQVATKYCSAGGGAEAAAALLAELALARGSRDNISIIVVDLKKHHPCTDDTATPVLEETTSNSLVSSV